jgi:DNA-binding response OmpR family regulator
MNQVWIVDDDEEIGEALQSMLGLLNYDQRFFTNARSSARALITDPTPDLILIDLNMPEVSGLELLDFIRSKPRLQGLPVLIISAETSQSAVENARQHGADGYLFKPISLGEMQAGINTALNRRK